MCISLLRLRVACHPSICVRFEKRKIDCARKFFSKITFDQIKYDVVSSYGQLMESCSSCRVQRASM